MAVLWNSETVRRHFSGDISPCPICDEYPEIRCVGDFSDRDLYEVRCMHNKLMMHDIPFMSTFPSTEISECIRQWNNNVKDYYHFNEQELHESFTEFLRSD